MEELKEKIDKMVKDIKSIAANQEGLKEKMKNNSTLLKNDLVLVERRLNDKLDILSEKQKNMDDKMSTIMQNINTLTQNMSTMTQNQNTMIGMLQKLRFGTNHISSSNMLDQYVNKNERNQVDQDNKQDKETNYLRNDQNTNNIVDKDELDQDHNGIQASIIDNKDDPYNENICIL